MEMKEMSMSRILELDAKRDIEVERFLTLGVAYGSPPPFFLHDEFADQLPEMARKFGVSLEEFETYVCVQSYINASAQTDCQDLPSPESVARKLGIPPVKFSNYLHLQMKLIQEALRD